MVDSIKINFQDLEIEDIAKEKLIGITIDGKNANTDKNSGLWVRQKQYLKKDIFCMRSSQIRFGITKFKIHHGRIKTLEDQFEGCCNLLLRISFSL